MKKKNVMKLKLLLICWITALPMMAQVTIDGKRPVYDNISKTYLLTLPDSVFGKPFIAPAAIDDSITWVTIDHRQVRGSVMIPKVSGDTTYEFAYLYNNRIYSSKLKFTFLPIMSLTGDFGTAYTVGQVQVTMPDEHQVQNYRARIKWAGGTTAEDWIHKHNFHIKFIDEAGEKLDVTFCGLRDDNHWRLDAGIVDMLRFRNKAAHSLWADFNTKSYYADKQPKARSYSRGFHVEMFLNGDYMGFFDMTEFLDRKQMKLKKYDETNGEFRGLMWKGKDNTNQTLFAASAKVDNTKENWGGFDVMYPDIDEVCPTDYSVLSNAVDFVSKSTPETFAREVYDFFDVPVLVDYYVFIHTLFAIDNSCKNIIWGCYDSQIDKKLTLAVWDLEATAGQHWFNGNGFHRARYIQPENELDSISTRYSKLSLSHLFMGLKNMYDFRWKTVNRYWQLRKTVLDPDSLVARYKAIYDRLDMAGALDREEQRWSGDDDISNLPLDFDDEFRYLEDWLRRRIAYMDTHTFACLRGDVNKDRHVNVNDLTKLISYLLAGGQGGNIDLINADVNGDNLIDINDVTALVGNLLNQKPQMP